MAHILIVEDEEAINRLIKQNLKQVGIECKDGGNRMYIFLDVDGVLNTKADWKKFYSLNQRYSPLPIPF